MRYNTIMSNLSEIYRWTSRTCGRRRGKCATALLLISKVPSLFWECCKHNMRIRNSSIYKKFSWQNVWTSYTGNKAIRFALLGVWTIFYFHIDTKLFLLSRDTVKLTSMARKAVVWLQGTHGMNTTKDINLLNRFHLHLLFISTTKSNSYQT